MHSDYSQSIDFIALLKVKEKNTSWSWFNFFCTKIGSKLARTYTDKHSLKEVTKEILGKDISKAQQSSDWGAATLTKNQMNYAANDVYNLIEIYKALKLMLERESRMDLAERTVHCVSVMADLDNFGYESVLEH